MPALDFHAHIEPTIAPAMLRELGACVVAVTRSLEEFAQVAERRDEDVTWGIGVHPAEPLSLRDFSPRRFRSLLDAAPVVGEVGLDRRSSVGLASQQDTLEAILRVLSEQPRILNVHSAGATVPILDLLEKYRPSGVVLHWWRGSSAQTERALRLGCSFSINAAEIARPRILEMLPRERVLTETDHPFGDRRQPGSKRPGRVDLVEAALAEHWNVDTATVRRQVWRNLLEIAETTGTPSLFPMSFQRSMLMA